ncbi:MAG: N-acetylglucosamine-6-phosphate deacetylase [Clostridia bacterium]|nr:N-acetylglucosamine-6-phosphate deacetylase [Clostridia bacterium]
MIIKNATVYDENFEPVKTDIEIENGIIKSLAKSDAEGLNFAGCVIIPGFIDIHIHGCNLADATDGKPDSAARMSKWLACNGITSFCPTTMTLPADTLRECFGYIADTIGKEEGAYIHGINMEGPFIAPEKKGAQDGAHIINPDFELFSELNSICPVKLVDIAPEREGAEEFTKKASKLCTVSAAHTTADYAKAKEAFGWGISHTTHLFNAMSGLGSREPGMVGAVLDSENVFAELICDGIHISPATLRITFKTLGEDRTVVISDATMSAGLEPGEYMLGGQKIFKTDAARLADGTLAGSSTNLFEEFHNLLKFGIPLKQAIKSLTINPARAIGADEKTGSISVGKNADLLILSEDFSETKAVFVKGKQVV